MAERVEVHEYLSKYPDHIARMALKLRNLLLEIEPNFDEKIKWNNLFYERNGPVCAILIHKAYINLEFPRGREITELGYFLEGTGKNMRHIKISPDNDLKIDILIEIINKALELNFS